MEVDDGYRGLANEFPGQVSAPPKKPKDTGDDDGPLTERYGWREAKRRQSSARICEHANAEHRQWRPLQRYTGRRETYGETHRAIAGLVSDRAARRPTRHKPSTELVRVRSTAC
ncbi:transposase [Streptomyces sioyaensis]|uniref:transposase n=1 Tax=Streptomyces sioyaensis TaxID=67364 RepID=UPI0033C02862